MRLLTEFERGSKAERARALRGPALGTLMVADLLADHEAIIRTLRVDLETCANKNHNIGANDFLTALMRKHEKTAWILQASLEIAEAPK